MIMCTSVCSGFLCAAAADAAENSSHGWLLDVAEGDAYIITGNGNDIKQSQMKFLDGNDGSMDAFGNEYTSTNTTVDGVDSRYFSKSGIFAAKLDDSFYETGDNTYIVSIVYYDYGPGRGTFYFNYIDTSGTQRTLSLIKPGKNPGWTVNNVMVNDLDPAATFADGSTVKVQCSTGGFNAFKKLEMVNVSRHVREGKPIDISCIKSEYTAFFKQIGFIGNDDAAFADSNMHNAVTRADAEYLLAVIRGKDAEAARKAHANDGGMTQNELLALFADAMGISLGTDPVAAAANIGLVSVEDMFLLGDSAAAYINAVNLAYKAMFFEQNGGSFALQLIDSGILTEEIVTASGDSKLQQAYYSVPKRLEYTRIEDHETGRTYYYLNMYGQPALRPYMTLQSWTADADGFIVGSKSGSIYNLFVYNITSQTIRYIDTNLLTYGQDHIDACVGTDNFVYYVKKLDNGMNAICKSSLVDIKPEVLIEIPRTVSVGGISLSADNRYIGFDYKEPYNPDRGFPEGTQMGARLDLLTGEWDVFGHNWEIANKINHTQINPVYTDMLFFCHEYAGTEYSTSLGTDRVWTVNLTTGEQKHMTQGELFGQVATYATHETWSLDGEWIYFVSAPKGYERSTAVAIIDKDLKHRQMFINPQKYFFQHCFGSGDAKYIAADGHYITIINTQTNQYFYISRQKADGHTQHPYHPHPHVAQFAYKVNWGGEYEGVLGIYWYDFSEIDENEAAKGGREELNETATYVNYEGIDCEVTNTVKGGRECLRTANDTALFVRAEESVADDMNMGVTITFDYYDEGRQPIIITYTKGVKDDNEYWDSMDRTKTVKRTNSKKWKTATVTIDSANFEKVSKYFSDFKIAGLNSQAYIDNVRVSAKQ